MTRETKADLIACVPVAFVLSGLVFAYAHRWWIERRLHKDLDGDGKIGEPTA